MRKTKPTYEDLLDLLTTISNRAVPAGVDSTGASMVKMRLDLIKEVRRTLKFAETGES